MCALAISTGRLPSEWEQEEPAAIATTINLLDEIQRKTN